MKTTVRFLPSPRDATLPGRIDEQEGTTDSTNKGKESRDDHATLGTNYRASKLVDRDLNFWILMLWLLNMLFSLRGITTPALRSSGDIGYGG
ncbi:hypothetical protein IGI04_013855 [Brassica rapa subsp. trilocularis]|uniref:Uncharacterized protein n=1 Tax=Brassica rapa subsp. trilocularis TaxID=1813537 RepID=A0ABQ7NC61_BRACM|nr:hypothetical protein IGI04_013855 [Brassica rapa subsp. trilocularis]